jgi:hypothetical protein
VCCRGDARYEWAHGIRKGTVGFKGRDVTRTRRLSLMLRDFKDDDVLKDHMTLPTEPRQY